MTETAVPNVLKSEVLARFVVETPSEAVPDAMVKKAVRHILDSIGAGVAGAVSVEAQRLTAVLREEGEGPGRATLWGRGETMTPVNAALVNGTASHAFELDDTGGCDHSGAVVVPAAVAAVELADRPVTGREFIDAVVIGYDVARRPLEACGAYEPHNGAGFHSTGTCGTFGAAAAAAFAGETGRMIALERISSYPYQCIAKSVDVQQVANLEKKVPLDWITPDGMQVTAAFEEYARPLILDEVTPVYVNGTPRHIRL